MVQLKETVQEMEAGLDSKIQTSGINLSVGQKQLFCLARAINHIVWYYFYYDLYVSKSLL